MSDRDFVDGARPYRVTADDYCRMIEAGCFGDAHVELVQGALVEMAPEASDRSQGCADFSGDA